MVRYTTRMGFRKNCNGGFLRNRIIMGSLGFGAVPCCSQFNCFRCTTVGELPALRGKYQRWRPIRWFFFLGRKMWARLVYDFMVLIKCYDYIVMDGNGDYLQNKKHDWRGAPPCIFMQPASSVYCKRKEVPCHWSPGLPVSPDHRNRSTSKSHVCGVCRILALQPFLGVR